MNESVGKALDNHDVDIWQIFHNQYLQEELKSLSAVEKREIARAGEAFANDCTFFKAIATKPHGLPRPESNRIDHAGFMLKGDLEETKKISEEIFSKLDVDQKQTIPLESEFAKNNVVQIFQHPSDPNQIVIHALLKNPGNTSSYDSRPVGNRYAFSIPQDSLAAGYFRGENAGKLVSFIVAAAAANIDPGRAQQFFDVPLSGEVGINKPKAVQLLSIANFPQRTASILRISPEINEPPRTWHAGPGQFPKICSYALINANSSRVGKVNSVF